MATGTQQFGCGSAAMGYLVLVDAVEVLPRLLGNVAISEAVRDEHLDPESPDSVREWAQHPPDWLEVMSVDPPSAKIPGLDVGGT